MLELEGRRGFLRGKGLDHVCLFPNAGCVPGYMGQDCQSECPVCDTGVSCSPLTGTCDGLLYSRQHDGAQAAGQQHGGEGDGEGLRALPGWLCLALTAQQGSTAALALRGGQRGEGQVISQQLCC